MFEWTCPTCRKKEHAEQAMVLHECDPYLLALGKLIMIATKHRDTYAANEQGLMAWHSVCATTFKEMEQAWKEVETI